MSKILGILYAQKTILREVRLKSSENWNFEIFDDNFS